MTTLVATASWGLLGPVMAICVLVIALTLWRN